MNYVILDIETRGDFELANKLKLFDNIKPDSRLKDPIKIEANIEDKKAKLKKDLALNLNFAAIRLITLKTPDTLYYFRNHEMNKEIETHIISEAMNVIIKKMSGSTDTGMLGTFNGKAFDLPIILTRAQTLRANINYMYLLNLMTEYKHKGKHLDLMEFSEGSLDLNCKRLFGEGKLNTQGSAFFDNCTSSELEVYAGDEIFKMERWFRLLQGLDDTDYDHFELFMKRGIYNEDYCKSIGLNVKMIG